MSTKSLFGFIALLCFWFVLLVTTSHSMHVEECDGPYAFQELDVVQPCLPLVFPRQVQHFVRHVEPVDLARGANAFRG